MLVTLVIVAGSVLGQTKFSPYPGGKYSYKINGISVTHASTVKITVPSGLTVSNVSPGTGTSAVVVGTTSITFDVTYDPAPNVGKKKILVELTDETSKCTNSIYYEVEMAAPPTLSLAISGVADICQELNLSPANNQDASIGAPANTFIFTVTPSIVAAGSPTYDFNINLADYGFGSSTIVHTSGSGTATPASAISSGNIAVTGATGVQTFTVSFTTTEGPGADITGRISDAKLHMEAGNGGQTYDGTITTSSDVVTVKALPTIGQFE
jgi:hypothetical protein